MGEHRSRLAVPVRSRPARRAAAAMFARAVSRAPGGTAAIALVTFSLLMLLLGPMAFRAPVLAQAPARHAPNFTPDSSDEAERLLRAAAAHARDDQWPEAIDLYQRVIERYGDKLVRASSSGLPLGDGGHGRAGGGDAAADGSVLHVSGRRYCHLRLSQAPPEALAVYRRRADGNAEHWYRQGAERRDEALLRRVIDEAFCSSWGDDALELLGDLAFQDGRFTVALSMYGLLAPDRPAKPDDFTLVYPGPEGDLAAIAAKKWLCRAALGHPPGPAEIAEFARRYPGASGALAGRKGPYADTLAAAVADDQLAPGASPEFRWPTFAGAPTRDRAASEAVDVGQVQWRAPLEKPAANHPAAGMAGRMGNAPVQASPEQLLAYQPIVLGDQVIVCDGSKVLAYNLNDRPGGDGPGGPGPVRPVWKYDPEDGGGMPVAPRASAAVPRFTLTAAGPRVFARMGVLHASRFTGINRFGMAGEVGASSIVALDWTAQGKLLWELKPSDVRLPGVRVNSRTLNFEGTPVADDQNVYVALTDRAAETLTYIACFDAETRAQRWGRYLGAARPEINPFGGFGMPMNWGQSAHDFHHRLLSLDGPSLYYLTDMGAVAALEAATGEVRWTASYPRRDAPATGRGGNRDLNPAIVYQGRVIVAPSDADAIVAFDAESGRMLWKTPPIADDVKLAHLLGVAHGRLVATGDRVVLVNVADGKLLSTWPDSSNKGLEGHGRGVLAGELIYWPTRSTVQVLSQRTGLRAAPPIQLRDVYHVDGGNLVCGDGYLIVAQADGLVVFCQNSRLIQHYRQEIVRAPDRASNYYRLARAAESSGRIELALESYQNAIARARGDEPIDGDSLPGAARGHVFHLLTRLADRARGEHHLDVAIARLRAADGYASTGRETLEARLRLSEALLEADRPGEAVGSLQTALLADGLRDLPVAAADGRRTVRADLLIADRLSAIVRRHGRAVYRQYDERAAELFERGKSEKDEHLLRAVCRDYPTAAVVPSALEAIGAIEEAAERWAEAARAYKRLSAAALDDEHRARALWSLARVHEARHLFLAARDAYRELVARFPKARAPGDGDGDGTTLAELAAAKLARPPYAGLAAEGPRPPLSLPLARRWHWDAHATDERPLDALAIEGTAPASNAGRIVVHHDGAIRMLGPATGSPLWSARLKARPAWAGYLSDKLIVASAESVQAFDFSQGTLRWRFDHGQSGRGPRLDPFLVEGPRENGPAGAGTGAETETETGSRRLHGFQIARDRVICLRGDRELLAINGDTGALDWSFAAPNGPINANLRVGEDRVVLQLESPNQLWELRAADGQTTARAPLGPGERLERPPLPLDGGAVLAVLDPRTVKKIDLGRGQPVWEYRESEDLPVNGPPRVFGEDDLVLVLHEGRTLIRLDPATGSKRWSRLLASDDLGDRPGAVGFDKARFYCIARSGSSVELRAFSLADGTPAWSQSWVAPEGPSWRLALAERQVIACPDRVGSADGDGPSSVPLVVLENDTGALVQRFLFPAAAPGRDEARAAAAAGQATGPAPSDRAAPGAVTFRIGPRGAMLATPSGAWGLGAFPGPPPPADRGAAGPP